MGMVCAIKSGIVYKIIVVFFTGDKFRDRLEIKLANLPDFSIGAITLNDTPIENFSSFQ